MTADDPARTAVAPKHGFTRENASQWGKIAVEAREDKRRKRLGVARERLEALLPVAVEALREVMEGKVQTVPMNRGYTYVVPQGPRVSAARFVVEYNLGQPTARIEHVNLDALSLEFDALVQEMAANGASH